jgi:hypothetical protein
MPLQINRVDMMQDDLLQLVCATYNNATMGGQDPGVAFERTVEMVQRRRPLLALCSFGIGRSSRTQSHRRLYLVGASPAGRDPHAEALL